MAHSHARTRLVAGVMTGTSLDGADAAVVRVDGSGLAMRARVLGSWSGGLGGAGEGLRRAAAGERLTALEFGKLGRALALACAEALRAAMNAAGVGRVGSVAAHGQTVAHEPPVSVQVLNGSVLAREVGAPVVFDLRAADLAAGGEGAPITPIADAVLFGGGDAGRVVVNLGGFVNATVLPTGRLGDAGYAERVKAFDVCACNHVLNRAAVRGWGSAFDEGGARAAGAEPVSGAVDAVAAVLRGQAERTGAGRSLGRTDEAHATLDGLLASHDAAAVARSSAEAIAAVVVDRIADAVRAGAGVVLAGGGARNAALAGAIGRRAEELGGAVVLSDELGVGVSEREAAAMAVLGALCADGAAITLPGVTGCGAPAPIAGVWAPDPTGSGGAPKGMVER